MVFDFTDSTISYCFLPIVNDCGTKSDCNCRYGNPKLLSLKMKFNFTLELVLSTMEMCVCVQVNVRVTTMDAELEFAIQPNTTGKQLFDQVRLHTKHCEIAFNT